MKDENRLVPSFQFNLFTGLPVACTTLSAQPEHSSTEHILSSIKFDLEHQNHHLSIRTTDQLPEHQVSQVTISQIPRIPKDLWVWHLTCLHSPTCCLSAISRLFQLYHHCSPTFHYARVVVLLDTPNRFLLSFENNDDGILAEAGRSNPLYTLLLTRRFPQMGLFLFSHTQRTIASSLVV